MKLASLQMESFLLGKLLGLVELGLVFSSKTFLFLGKKKKQTKKRNTVKRRKLYSKNAKECLSVWIMGQRIPEFIFSQRYFYQEERDSSLKCLYLQFLKLLAEEVLICVSFSNVESLWTPVSVSVSSFLSHLCSRGKNFNRPSKYTRILHPMHFWGMEIVNTMQKVVRVLLDVVAHVVAVVYLSGPVCRLPEVIKQEMSRGQTWLHTSP